VQIWTIMGVGQYLIPIIVLLLMKVPRKSCLYLIVYPLFMYSWIPVNLLGIKDRHKMKWSHTLHTPALTYESAPLLRK
ncbi:glycosyl transferase family 2, partial [Megasphaera massiliensis]|nr:glycosyl transferase family 2 [Megasphaera massiliensis]